jgi:hypothetical protein
MKATIERATLLKCLGHVQSVVERRNTIPILSNVLIEASADGSIRMMATDLDLQINESVEARPRFRRTHCLILRASCPRGAKSRSPLLTAKWRSMLAAPGSIFPRSHAMIFP